MSLLKLAVYSVGGAVGLAAAVGFGGVGLVAGGAAAGLSALEVAVVGGGIGSTVYKIRQDKAQAKRSVSAADLRERQAKAAKSAADLRAKESADKIAKARKVLEELEA